MSSPRQHTPGPWVITAEGGAIVGNEGGTLVVETSLAYWENLACSTAQSSGLASRHIPEVMANARLIASAPDLLAALEATEAKLTQAARAFYGAGNAKALREAFEGWRTTAEAARAAIAKATATK